MSQSSGPRSLGAQDVSEEIFRHFTFVTAGFHIFDRFHMCNRMATVKCEKYYKYEKFHKCEKNHRDCV